jgi:hypothetical protein
MFQVRHPIAAQGDGAKGLHHQLGRGARTVGAEGHGF